MKLKVCFAVCASVLLLAACASSRPQPSFVQTPSGNAWALTLPKGTVIKVADPRILAAAINEVGDGGVLIEDCVLVSRAYLIERDEKELQQLSHIEELKIRKGP